MRSGPWVTLLAATGVVATGCGGPATASGNPSKSLAAGPGPTPPAATVTVTPSDAAADVRPDQPVVVSAANGTLNSVSLAADDQPLAGATSLDGTRWTSSDPLLPSRRYVVHAVAAGPGGSASVVASFRTVAGRDLTATVSPDDGQTVGVGMPIVMRFNAAIPEDRQLELMRHVSVTSNPPAPGAWHWWTLQEVHFRPAEYWAAGTKVTMTADLRGVPGIEGTWGREVVSRSFTVGEKHVTTVDDATHMAIVTNGDKVIAAYPVSLGKPGFTTISGTLWVRYKLQKLKMNSCLTFGGPACIPGSANYYDEFVYWDTAVSTNGFFFHAAPWSVGDQGVRDVSHGCINASPSAAQTFFNFSQVGDVVVVQNTTRVADEGDGEGDWQVPFAHYANSGPAAA